MGGAHVDEEYSPRVLQLLYGFSEWVALDLRF